MVGEEDNKKTQTVEARARNISHNVRCTECGSQSIEDSQADVAILLRKVLLFICYASPIFRLVDIYIVDFDIINCHWSVFLQSSGFVLLCALIKLLMCESLIAF